MNLNYLIRKIELYAKVAQEDNSLSVILKEIDKLESYNAMKKYAENKLKHLSSGSSRLVYLTDEKTVVKLAKNDKGIEQNKIESQPMKSPFINEIISHSPKYNWLETHYLKKVTQEEFKKMSGVDFSDFCDTIRYVLKDVASTSATKPKNFDKISKTKIVQEMEKIGKKFKLMPGDMVRISSWGARNSQLVLIDAGLNRKLYDSLYE